MKWSLRIARVSGIDVYLHWTFLVLLAVVTINELGPSSGSAQLNSVWFILLLFLFVLLHEFGHALMGQRFGVKTSSITLLPIGGVASMERMPENPWHELWIALAGPAVNVVLATIIFLVLYATGQIPDNPNWFNPEQSQLWLSLLTVNIMLFAFNLIPAFPMDGGRVLRALLSMKYDRTTATNFAARIGQLLAIGFVFIGLMSNFWLVFIGIFIYLGAGAEANYEATHSVLSRYKVRDVLMHQHTILGADQTIEAAVRLLLDGQEKEFLVSENDNLVGTITRDELIAGLGNLNKETPIGAIANRNLILLNPEQTLDEAFDIFNQSHTEICPVLEDGILVGVLNRENILEKIMIETALQRRNARKPAFI